MRQFIMLKRIPGKMVLMQKNGQKSVEADSFCDKEVTDFVESIDDDDAFLCEVEETKRAEDYNDPDVLPGHPQPWGYNTIVNCLTGDEVMVLPIQYVKDTTPFSSYLFAEIVPSDEEEENEIQIDEDYYLCPACQNSILSGPCVYCGEDR